MDMHDSKKRICKIMMSWRLAQKAGLEACLNESGIRVTVDLLEDVRKRFLNDWCKRIGSSICVVNVETFCVIMRKYARAQKVDEVIYSLINRGETDEAYRVFRRMIKVFDPDVDTYTVMVNMFRENDKLEMAMKCSGATSSTSKEGDIRINSGTKDLQVKPSERWWGYGADREMKFMDFEAYINDDEKIIDDTFTMGVDTDLESKMIDRSFATDMDSKIIERSLGLELFGHEDIATDQFSDEGGELAIHDQVYENDRPYIGMEFESEQAAMIYYDAYAKRTGFILRVGNCHRSGRDGPVISRRFLCNKEGFRQPNNKAKHSETRKPRETTREGCKAMIMVRKDKSGRWVITKLEINHSHPLGLPATKSRRGSVQARPQVSQFLEFFCSKWLCRLLHLYINGIIFLFYNQLMHHW
ncbi:hypothetical protein GIB67_016650 [Kingdonia uniflora]|uniref:FAR1 domain-containing protein n=1 Tax=Kingdonia uniflora TaxID=39325 RepID=A0A7J7MZH3_9MAGN|nr:hypothetical protein GIB67_016650 [Kingdonia uniflora]